MFFEIQISMFVGDVFVVVVFFVYSGFYDQIFCKFMIDDWFYQFYFFGV